MKPKVLEPMSTTDILQNSFRILGQHFKQLTLLAFVCWWPNYLVAQTKANAISDGSNSGAMSIAMQVAEPLVGFLTACLMARGMTIAVSEYYAGGSISGKAIFAQTVKECGPLFKTMFRVSLWICLGFLLLIVPGVFWAFALSLVVPVVVIEGKQGASALSRSKELYAKDRGRVQGVVVGMCLMLVTLAMGIAAGEIWAWHLMGQSVKDPYFQPLASLLIVPLKPLFYIAPALLYYDLRVRYEDYNLDRLVEDLPRARL